MHISKDEKLNQLDKIINGRSLHSSESLKAFLRFVVDRSVEDQEQQLKEYVIATEVFGRGSDFDPRVDSVVRVQAGRLRNKLAEYYADEGKDDRIIIDLPKGHYTPVFLYAETTKQDYANGDIASLKINGLQASATTEKGIPDPARVFSVPINQAPIRTDPSTGTSAKSGRIWILAAIVLAVLSLALGFAAIRYRAKTIELEQSLMAGSVSKADLTFLREIEPLWGYMLRSTEPVLVVYSNTLFQGSAETGMKLLKSLNSPGSSIGSPSIPQTEIEQSTLPILEHYTGIGEVMGSYFLGDFFARVQHSSRLKRSLLLTWEDLKTENIVVLGSPAENLFLRDLPQQQDFIFKQMNNEDKLDFGVLNTNIKPGEQEQYFARQDGPSRSQISEDFAVISLLQGVTGKKRMLILAGITTLGTQAAAEYVTKVEYIGELVSHLNIAPAGAPPKLPLNYQVLVRVKVNGGVPVQVSYVTHHVLEH